MIKWIYAVLLIAICICVFTNTAAELNPRRLDEQSPTNNYIYKASGYIGNWKQQNHIQNMLFTLNSGQAQIRFLNHNNDFITVCLLLCNGDILDSNTRIFHIPLYHNSTWNQNIKTEFTIFSNELSQQSYKGNFLLNNSDMSALTLHLADDNLKFNITITAKVQKEEDLQEPIVSYSFVITCIGVALIFSFSKHSQDCINSENFARKTSIEFLMLQSAVDLCLSIWHLYLSTIYYKAFDYLMLAAFMNFAVYLIINGKLIMSVYRAHNPSSAQDGHEAFRRRLSIFESFQIILITSLIPIIILAGKYMIFIILAMHSYIPQIILSASKGYKFSIKPTVIIVITISRMILLLYIFGLSDNFTSIMPNYEFCVIIICLLVLQLVIVLLQNKHPRFFIPKICRPKVYSYFKDHNEEKLQDKTECIICMTELNLAGHDNNEVINFSRTMHTPCRHMFHEDCLSNWMSVKMECPTCRTPLPLIEE
ncbi:hypothetical protein SteCoe_8547 [Stentor coeruleus]|uniref:RING-type E3 ubiquitin transferase n=1 Tax=Stentor coeruleus TaxID=5963 RepID=A0A1R2CK21_9CILI|nr:hypothetical protein SteCoe_8547 [Stentor coeruleus]